MESIQEWVRRAASPMLEKGIGPVVFSFHIDGCATALAIQFSKKYNASIGGAHPIIIADWRMQTRQLLWMKIQKNLQNLYAQMALHWHKKSRQWQ